MRALVVEQEEKGNSFCSGCMESTTDAAEIQSNSEVTKKKRQKGKTQPKKKQGLSFLFTFYFSNTTNYGGEQPVKK